MTETNCIFCKIITQEILTPIVAQNDEVIAIKDIAPKAPVHYLIIPKKHIKDVVSVSQQDEAIAGKIFALAQELAVGLSGSQSFRLILNNGRDSGQSVFHLHTHFLSGKKMLDF